MNTAPDALSTALQMFTALGIVLGGLLVVFYFMKRFLKRDKGGSNQQLIRVVASQYVGIKKNIALVEVPGAVLVVGISNDNISMLTKIEDKIVIDGIRQERSRITPSFTDHLQRLTARIKQAKNSE
jgi:flagellar protein FliO/FliZ